jgi:putative spermidine/putrescine transport system permease protein
VAAMKKSLSIALPSTLAIAALFIFLPFGSSAEFSFRSYSPEGKLMHSFAPYQWILQQPEFMSHLLLSFKLSLIAVAFTAILVVPSVAWLHLKAQSFRSIIEVVTILPLVIPVVALSIGVQAAFPDWLQSTEYELPLMYVILSLPFTFRILDNGLQAIPLKTISEASRGLGANWPKTIIFVIAPVMRSAVAGAFFLTFALSLGEFTLTSLLHWDTFPTWVTSVSQQNIIGAIALSVFSLTVAFVVLLLVGLFSSQTKKRTEVAE